MKYKVDKNVPTGSLHLRAAKSEMYKLAETMEVGDSIFFENRWDNDTYDDIMALMASLNSLYGVKHNKKLIRACTRKTIGPMVRVWRIDPQEKIKAREAKK